MRSTEQIIHISINLTVSESDYDFYDPRVNAMINMSIPVEMFESKKLAEMVEKRINTLKTDFPKEKAEYERKQAEAEAEKAKQEAEKV